MTVVTDEPLTVGDLTPKVIEGSVNAGHEDFTGPYDVGTRSGRASAIQDAIDFAENQSPELPFVLVPDALGPGVSGYDASLVNFSGSGGTWTGRMMREGQRADVYDVKAYGAHPDNTASENQSALQAAFGPDRMIYVPAGQYDSDQLTVFEDMTLVGQGREVTQLRAVTSSATVFMVSDDPTVDKRNLRLEGLEIFLPASGTAATTLAEFDRINGGRIRDCRFNGSDVSGSVGLRIDARPQDTGESGDQGFFWIIEGTLFFNLDTPWHFIEANANSFFGGRVQSCNGPAIMDSCNQVRMVGHDFQTNPGITTLSIRNDAAAGCRMNIVFGCKFEDQDVGIELQAGVSDMVIIGNEFSLVGVEAIRDNSGNDHLVFNDEGSRLDDPARVNQVLRLWERSSLPAADTELRGGLVYVPEVSGDNASGRIRAFIEDGLGGHEVIDVAHRKRGIFLPPTTDNPPVAGKRLVRTNNGSAHTYTDFARGEPGQMIIVKVEDANTTFQDQSNGSSISLEGGVDYAASDGDILTFVERGAVWYEISRRTA